MEGTKVTDTQATISQIMTPQDVNKAGNVHGGVIMKLVDNAAGVVAVRHARSNVVTASIDRLNFHHPVYIGDLVSMKASLNMVGKTSMEVGVRVEAENPITGKVNLVASAYLTMVALDENSKPRQIPPLILKSETEKRRNREAQARREIRLRER